MSKLNNTSATLTRSALSPIELANRWGTSRQHIYDLLKDRRLNFFRTGRHLRIPMLDIEAAERGEST